MKLLRSFEEFVFEAISWLVFYPVTVWRIVARPLATMAYSDAEQQDTEERRYDDALSPPLLLLITVVLVSAIGTLLHTADVKPVSKVTEALMASPQNIALFRALAFSLVPLVAAATLLRRTDVRLSRDAGENARIDVYLRDGSLGRQISIPSLRLVGGAPRKTIGPSPR